MLLVPWVLGTLKRRCMLPDPSWCDDSHVIIKKMLNDNINIKLSRFWVYLKGGICYRILWALGIPERRYMLLDPLIYLGKGMWYKLRKRSCFCES
jgi:hypothetical protein